MNPHSATRLYVTCPLNENAVVGLESNQAHYLRAVLRLTTGAFVTLFNGVDGEWLAKIDGMGKSWSSLVMVNKLRDQIDTADLWLLFAPIKKTRLSMIIEKAVELGVTKILPTLTERTNVERVRTPRLTATAIEAAEQCERLDIPEIIEPAKLDKILESWDKTRILLVCAEFGEVTPITQTLKALENKGNVAFLIGPEGGFSKLELEKLSNHSFVIFVGLGPRILRAETAVISALACWQSIRGDWTFRPPHRS